MEMSVKAAEVLVPPKPDVASSSSSSDSAAGEAAPPAACGPSSDYLDPMEKFSRRLQDIISAYGSAAGALDRQRTMEAEMQKMEEAKDDITAVTEADVSAIMQSLNQFSSAQDKLEEVVRRCAELAACRRRGERRLGVLQQRASVLLEEARGGGAARGQLEGLCRELQGHYSVLREESLQHCREDEEKRKEMGDHFQGKLAEIQAQIEQHSVRNDKLCRENAHLTDKLESLMSQCELREESLEKINKRRDLQQKLSEAKLLQANALLTEAEEKHKREKEYLLREAIDKTKKCFAMKEQELAMKKKLTLYAQKFDEFQETLAKSNQIYGHFKKEMDNMTEKMKKMEKESNLWKTRFENCNRALTDMMEERKEKVQEYDMFVLKIQKLERLCRALQEERVVLYDKIKEVRRCNASIPPKESGSPDPDDITGTEDADKSALMQELQEVQDQDPVLTEDMSRLREEQAKLQEFAASLFTTPSVDVEEDSPEVDNEEDEVAAAFVKFKSKPQATEEAGSAPEQEVQEKAEEPVLLDEERQKPAAVPAPSETKPADVKAQEVTVQPQVEGREVQPRKPDEEVQQQPPEPEPEKVPIDPPADLRPAAEAEISTEAGEVKPAQEAQIQVQPSEAPTGSESAPSSKTSRVAESSSSDASRKQTPKKKKRRSGKNAS